MIPTAYLRILPVLLILADQSIENGHSMHRKTRRVHPRNIHRRSLIDDASTEVKTIGNTLLNSVGSTSKKPAISNTSTHTTDTAKDSYAGQGVGSKTIKSADTSGQVALKVGASIGVGVSQSGTGYSPTTYKLLSESSGKNFFDAWDFFSEADPTHGLVSYQPSESAWKTGLVSIGQNTLSGSKTGYSSGTGTNYPLTARMKVDSTSWLKDGQSRNSVRLTSKASFKYGLLILDAIKMPYGCSTWPAFWTVGDDWPRGGEIDIVEGVNMLTKNQMTLHTSPGCSLKKQMGRNATGEVYTTDCDANANYNTGCGVGDLNAESYGQGFNKAGGGVFAMEWKSSGISIWRFPRATIPRDILNKQPNPQSWTHPAAFWDSSDCDALRNGFSQHKVVFDITVCGDWAGSAGVFGASGCSGSCSEAVKDPSNFANAEWEIASVQLYQ